MDSSRHLPDRDLVLIVDDMPTNLHMLSTALNQAGYTALVALDGFMALEQLTLITPGVILLDAMMPGMDGFEVCRRLQADPRLRDIPVIFMTALDDTDNVVRGFEDGAVDYLVKPVRPAEVIARIAAHLRRSRYSQQARQALETLDRAAVAVDPVGRVLWMTEKAETVMEKHFPESGGQHLPKAMEAWLQSALMDGEPGVKRFTLERDGQVLTANLNVDERSGGGLLLFTTESRQWPTHDVKEHLGLTSREAEILMWVAYGKTNRQIGEILGISPRTVNKHLDHIFMKLGVENRAAAAAIAIRSAQAL